MPQRLAVRAKVIALACALMGLPALVQASPLLVPSARPHAPFMPSGAINPDRVNVLHAQDAIRIGRFQSAPLTHLKGEVYDWIDADQGLRWVVDVPETADYGATALISVDSKAPMQLTVSADDGSSVTSPFRQEPRGGQSASPIDGLLHLTQGRHLITLRATPTPVDAPFSIKFLSVELVRPSVRDTMHREALAMRADARWMSRIPFALGVHWTARTMPRRGRQKSYQEQVNAFDTERFAEQIASTGAGAVVVTTAHSDQYLPFPNSALDSILPGRTARRDLVADLIKSLSKRNIRLILYYHLGPIEDQPWGEATGMWNSDSTPFFANWQRIISEAGRRYGKGLAGWWFDDGLYNAYYRSPDWAALDRAAKAGSPERVICFNSYAGARATEFQDFYCGEEVAPYATNAFLNQDGSLNGTLEKGGDGRITKGGYQGLQAANNYPLEGEWVHTERDSEAPPPRLSAEQLAEAMGKFKAYGGLTILNLAVYQDGTIAEASLRRVREAVKQAGL